MEAGEGSRFVDRENDFVEIETIALDGYIEDKVTFIKMDIEGAEFAALKGAERIICNQKPKLAISVYHRREDIWEIPKLLLEYNPDYKFFSASTPLPEMIQFFMPYDALIICILFLKVW